MTHFNGQSSDLLLEFNEFIQQTCELALIVIRHWPTDSLQLQKKIY